MEVIQNWNRHPVPGMCESNVLCVGPKGTLGPEKVAGTYLRHSIMEGYPCVLYSETEFAGTQRIAQALGYQVTRCDITSRTQILNCFQEGLLESWLEDRTLLILDASRWEEIYGPQDAKLRSSLELVMLQNILQAWGGSKAGAATPYSRVIWNGASAEILESRINKNSNMKMCVTFSAGVLNGVVRSTELVVQHIDGNAAGGARERTSPAGLRIVGGKTPDRENTAQKRLEAATAVCDNLVGSCSGFDYFVSTGVRTIPQDHLARFIGLALGAAWKYNPEDMPGVGDWLNEPYILHRNQ